MSNLREFNGEWVHLVDITERNVYGYASYEGPEENDEVKAFLTVELPDADFAISYEPNEIKSIELWNNQ